MQILNRSLPNSCPKLPQVSQHSSHLADLGNTLNLPYLQILWPKTQLQILQSLEQLPVIAKRKCLFLFTKLIKLTNFIFYNICALFKNLDIIQLFNSVLNLTLSVARYWTVGSTNRASLVCSPGQLSGSYAMRPKAIWGKSLG